MAQHYVGMRLRSEHKYQVLAQAAENGHKIRFRVLCYTDDLGAKEGEMIRQYEPSLNTQMTNENDWRHFTVNPTAKTITLE